MITSDEILLARLQVVDCYSQMRRYLKVGRPFYFVDYYTDIGQNDQAKHPYHHHVVVTELKHQHEPDLHLHYESVQKTGSLISGSMLFSERLMDGHDVFAVNEFDMLLKLLEKLWNFVNSPDNKGILKSLPFMDKNMRRAIKRLKRHMKANEKFGEFAILQAGHTQWYKKVMKLLPKDEPESSSDEEPAQDIAKEDIGKVPVYYCKKCKWVVGGFTCRAACKSGTSTCGEVLVVQEDGNARCPKGCGVMSPPHCCRRWAMKAQVATDSKYIVSASSVDEDGEISWEACPIFSCKRCGFGVDGIRCFTCTRSGCGVVRNGFFERVWCSYVWTCPQACGRRGRGGLTANGFIKCKCKGEKDIPLAVHGYVDKFGPPQN